MANPFYVEPVNALQALMVGDQSYDQARKRKQEDEMRAGRKEAAAAAQGGGDLRGPLAKLLSVGDTQGASAIATFAHQQATEKQATAGLAETSRHNVAVEGLTREGQNKGIAVAPGSELVNPSTGQKLYGDSSSVKLDPPTIDAMARQAMSGDTSVFTNLGRGAQGAENVVAVRKRIAELNSQGGESGAEQANRNAEFFGAKAGQRTLGTRSANIEMAATEFKQVLPIVMQASNAVSRTNYPDINKIIQAYQEKTGDPNVVKFGGGLNTLVNLYARAINPTGTPTVSDKDHARGILQKAWSQGQFNAAVGMMEQEIDAALSSPEKVKENMRGRFLGHPAQQPAAAQPPAPAAAGNVVDWKTYFGSQ